MRRVGGRQRYTRKKPEWASPIRSAHKGKSRTTVVADASSRSKTPTPFASRLPRHFPGVRPRSRYQHVRHSARRWAIRQLLYRVRGPGASAVTAVSRTVLSMHVDNGTGREKVKDVHTHTHIRAPTKPVRVSRRSSDDGARSRSCAVMNGARSRRSFSVRRAV